MVAWCPPHGRRSMWVGAYVDGMARRRGQTSRSGGVNRVAHITGSEYPDELHLLLKNEVMIRRLKINVVKQLPPLRCGNLLNVVALVQGVKGVMLTVHGKLYILLVH